MPRYDVELHRSARRELDALEEAARERLTDTLVAVAETREPTSHEAVRALEGQPDAFRVRVGSVRAVCQLDKPSLQVLAVGPRKSVYDGIDDVIDARATA